MSLSDQKVRQSSDIFCGLLILKGALVVLKPSYHRTKMLSEEIMSYFKRYLALEWAFREVVTYISHIVVLNICHQNPQQHNLPTG